MMQAEKKTVNKSYHLDLWAATPAILIQSLDLLTRSVTAFAAQHPDYEWRGCSVISEMFLDDERERDTRVILQLSYTRPMTKMEQYKAMLEVDAKSKNTTLIEFSRLADIGAKYGWPVGKVEQQVASEAAMRLHQEIIEFNREATVVHKQMEEEQKQADNFKILRD